jgi:hypothetical protein
MSKILSIHWVIISAVWYFVNGILHDIFVLINHKGPYNRELLRLLMDGHVLILSGVIMFVCYLMVLNKLQYGALIAIIITVAMLVYCIMIYPFLKSFGTMIISIMTILACLNAYSAFPDINQLIQKFK